MSVKHAQSQICNTARYLMQLVQGLGEAILVHLELLDKRLDIVGGCKSEHLPMRCARCHWVGHQIVAV